ncbi:TonB-dependent receptor [Ravibacter arvi]|uniref:TonB-dependent receptor n=1 Tax=Ravibacter arvi TaxID=2051041 RepID=A0ABP8M1E5_9BACT
MRKILPLLFLLILQQVHAQNERYTIKGAVADTTGGMLSHATVMLLNPVDSALVTFGRTNDKGALEFRNVKRSNYLLKVNYVGYLPFQQLLKAPEGNLLDLGTIKMKVLNKDLMEVVIKTARAPLSIRGDTVEYNASSFKVPPGSSVEDLLRRLPGVQVDQEGNIKAQGQEVKRVTVDGKRFFGDDPKAATRNLPAEAITKVQVFDSKTEEARLTGVDDGKREKTVNLELKDSHKKGGFGKATLGLGTDKRAMGKVNYNRFDDKNQLAVIGMGNNVNQTGISRDDYQDFRGSQSFNWGGGEFGFGGGWDMYEGIDVDWGGNRDRGFSENWAGGVNYNYETKKTKFSTYYYYNQTRQTLDAFTEKQNFLNQLSYRSDDKNSQINRNRNHRTSIRFEKQLDSLNTIVVENQIRIGNGNNRYDGVEQYFLDGGGLRNLSKRNNAGSFESFLINTKLMYNHKFRKKGRSWAVSGQYNINNSSNLGDQFAHNTFFGATPIVGDSIYVLNQHNDTESLNNQIKAGTQYVEPIGKKFFIETFYNFGLSKSEVERAVFDVADNGNIPNDFLSRDYTNEFYSNRGGTKLRYTHLGLNMSVGIAAQHFGLNGRFYGRNSEPASINKSYFGWIPNVSFSHQITRNLRAYVDYSPFMRLPNIVDLQPFVDNSNPLFIREGNPGLRPETQHNAYINLNYFNSGSFFSIGLWGNYNYRENQIIYAQTVDSKLVTYTKPQNISGGQGVNLNVYSSIPLVKTKLTFRVDGGISQFYQLTPINGVDNETRTFGVPVRIGFDVTPSQNFTFYPSARWNVNNTKYSVSTSQNQKISNITYSGEMNLKMPKEIYLNGALNYNIFKNPRQGFYLDQPILNLALYKLILKNKRGEIRLTAFDLFNKNQGVRVYTSQNFSSREQVQTLGRYFMLGFTYNMRGITAKMQRNNYY